MQLALTDVFPACWTDRIHEEWTRNVLANRPDLSPASLARCRRLMDEHVPDCLVTDYRILSRKPTSFRAGMKALTAPGTWDRLDSFFGNWDGSGWWENSVPPENIDRTKGLLPLREPSWATGHPGSSRGAQGLRHVGRGTPERRSPERNAQGDRVRPTTVGCDR